MCWALIIAGFAIGMIGQAMDGGDKRGPFLTVGNAIMFAGVALIVWGFDGANLPTWIWD
jgi:hypothetical protein